MRKQIKLFDPHVDLKEAKVIQKVLNSHNWASGSGSNNVFTFENNFKKYLKTKGCIAVNNGTSALHLALSLFDIKNKEIILPSLSFVSTAHAIIYNGGIPKFIDVDEETLCIDPTEIEKSINKKSAVILPVHFAGMPSNLFQIKKIALQNNLKIVEDAAHATGSLYKNKKIGTHGDAVCFSFHPVKNLAMPTGGAISLNGKNHREQEIELKSKRWCGISNRKGVNYDVDKLGWNYYMNEFSAAIGIEQLKKLDLMNNKKKKIAKRYCKELQINDKMSFNKNCSYHLFWIRVKNRNRFMKQMIDNGIETGIHYKPIHKMTFYNKKISLPITEKISNEIVSIPIHSNLSDENISKIIDSVNKFSS
jgi:perosamine synthetase